MKQKYIISSSLILGAMLLSACAKKPVKAAEFNPDEVEDAEKTVQPDERRPGMLKVSFKNDRAALEYTIDPNDEDLYIQLSGGEVQTQQTQLAAKESPQPIQITQTVQTPAAQEEGASNQPPDLGSNQKDSSQTDAVGIPEEDATDRVLADIRKAQQALYNNDLGQAEKLVRNSLGIRETSDGFALLGTIHYMRKDNRRAVDAWQRSLSIDPDQDQIKKMIYKVESQGN